MKGSKVERDYESNGRPAAAGGRNQHEPNLLGLIKLNQRMDHGKHGEMAADERQQTRIVPPWKRGDLRGFAFKSIRLLRL